MIGGRTGRGIGARSMWRGTLPSTQPSRLFLILVVLIICTLVFDGVVYALRRRPPNKAVASTIQKKIEASATSSATGPGTRDAYGDEEEY